MSNLKKVKENDPCDYCQHKYTHNGYIDFCEPHCFDQNCFKGVDATFVKSQYEIIEEID